MAEGQDRGRGGLGQKGLGAGNDAGHGGRRGQPVFERQDEYVVEHLLFFHQRDPGLVVDEQHVDDPVALFHQLGGVVPARHDAVNIFVGHLGHPLERRALGVARHGAVFPLEIIKRHLRAVQIPDAARFLDFV